MRCVSEDSYLTTCCSVTNEEVFLKINEENIAKKSEIKVGDRSGGFIEVFEGIIKGEKIVAEGLKKVRPNGKIKPIIK